MIRAMTQYVSTTAMIIAVPAIMALHPAVPVHPAAAPAAQALLAVLFI
jgi:hypothetical protein